ncbi:ABC transporter permease [Streptomyces sp. AV19]|uniref:ABC transporter permease n=1 Tax=Streptomyces sp. AV19 TaxID=2793068 RepID=UPI0018FED1D8|nr:ABC transporter permease [Streptomyces sp. AV19]MBH1937421.1 ABC transporter permease [Streptomyces sp. AV19]MDG4533806.1 ABC transporter permease [Streptomyces sp. AV19]
MTTAVRAVPGGVRHEMRAVRVVWQREMMHFLRNRGRLAITLAQPVLLLLVLGTGLSALVPASAGAGDYRTYLFPGVLVMTVQMPAIGAGASIVWDREAGFLREMLVAPVRRDALLLGKCAGGATVATCQGVLVLALAGTAHVPYDPALFATLTGELALAALALTALGAVAAVCITRMQTFQAVLGFAMMPMLFLSGAMFPLSGLPRWLTVLCLANPLTYAVDPLRRAVAAHAPGAAFPSPGWQPPVAAELGITAAIAVAALAVAARRFARPG